VTCVETNTPVSIAAGLPANYRIYGELCTPVGSDPSMVQVLLPGGTYNHNYWDFPYQPEKYSYVRHMTAAGYTTFNVDRIGTGNSSHPPSALVDLPSNAYVVHQLVQKLRTGGIAARTFSKVLLVGHSLGTLVSMKEASLYKDVDGLVLTGITHKINPSGAPEFNSLLWPALQDPRMRDRDPGYVTTRPGTRGSSFFYNEGNFDPKAVEADENYAKDSLTALELAQFPTVLLDGTTEGINVPVFLGMGEKDSIFCGPLGSDCSSAASVKAQEAPYYPNTEITTFVLPASGHCMNTHLNAGEWYSAARSWIEESFPSE
jgi:pimeloyl-ACP methyl ester carboxylesterase